ncbi:MAG: NAD(P)-dependent oxidoreductase [Actinomycetota bacterium]|nr:NAD(P)-dependent oxidoreductase [Actinomycetota bacterium]
MNILVTGGFGSVGLFTIQELLKKDCNVRVMELKTAANEKIYKKFKSDIEVIWGDITRKEDVERAVENQDAVIHLAYIIPPLSEEKPDLAWEVNIEGTRNLLNILRTFSKKIRIIFASSVSVFGNTKNLKPPRTTLDPVIPTDNYSHHKVACEQLIKISGLDWVILRLGAVLSVSLCELDPLLFRVPLDTRIELIHAHDAGIAFANAVLDKNISKKILLIGGGPSCQMYQREFVDKVLSFIGIGMLPDESFSSEPYYLDWMDTTESQNLLKFQNKNLDDFLEDIKKHLGFRRNFSKILKPFVRYWLLSKSPYLKKNNSGKNNGNARVNSRVVTGTG